MHTKTLVPESMGVGICTPIQLEWMMEARCEASKNRAQEWVGASKGAGPGLLGSFCGCGLPWIGASCLIWHAQHSSCCRP